MKSTKKYIIASLAGLFLFSACTMGDKGSTEVPDSVKIDTNIKASQPAQEATDTTLIDSLQTDSGKTGNR